MGQLRSWVVTEGAIGMENQALGLAEAMGLVPTVKRLRAGFPWTVVPPRLWLGALHAVGRSGDRLEPPWPDMVISCGKRSAMPALAVKRASAGQAFAVHIQAPPVDYRRFDLVVVPKHDSLEGEGVFTTMAAIHRVTPEGLTQAAQRFAADYVDLPRPLVAVLIGGSNRRHRLTPTLAVRLGDDLARLCREQGAGLLITPSRRTGAENLAALRAPLSDLPVKIWEGEGENPYLGYLALADAIVVTSDSVSMASEACSTGKPVYVIPLEGRSRRLEAFHESLRLAGMTRPFTGHIESWHYQPPDDTKKAGLEVWRRFQRARGNK